MSQAFPHQPVMATEVVDLLSGVPAGLVLDATLGGAGHAAALLEAHPGIRLLGIDRDPIAVAAATGELAVFGDRAIIRQVRFDSLGGIVASGPGRARAPPRTSAGSPACCSTSGSAHPSSTWPSAASPTGGTPPSTCGWTRPSGEPRPTW